MGDYISVTMTDSYGRTTKKRVELETQADLAAYLAAVTTFVTNLVAVSDLGIARADLVINIPGAVSTPAIGSNIDTGATIQGVLVGTEGKRASFKVPGISSTYINGDGTINLTTAPMPTLLGMFLDAGPLTISDGEVISAWIGGTLDK